MRRGEIYYIENNYNQEIGSEQRAGRPAIIVSNDRNNEHSPTVEIVYLTTQPKADMPTHVDIRSTQRSSVALCEQINTVSKERIGDYYGVCSEQELDMLDAALSISLGLGRRDTKPKPASTTAGMPILPIDSSPSVVRLTAERDVYKAMYEELVNKLIGGTQ